MDPHRLNRCKDVTVQRSEVILLNLPLRHWAGLPVVDELCHELEDWRGACWVVVPQFDGPLQDGHVGWVSAERVKDTLSSFTQ